MDTAAARLVVIKILPAASMLSPSMDTVDAPLNPNQQNHKMKTPRAPSVMLCPSMALGFPSLYIYRFWSQNISSQKCRYTAHHMYRVEPAKS